MTNDNIREDGKPAHTWERADILGLKFAAISGSTLICKHCGVLKGSPRYPETPCKGKVKITLR